MKTDILKKGLDLAVAKAPELLSATAIVGVGATGFLSARAGVKHQEAIADAEVAKMEALGLKEIPDLDPKEKFLATWKVWAPPVAVGATTIGCIVASNRVSASRFAELSAMYAGSLMSEKIADEFKEAVINRFGPDGYDAVNSDITQKHVDEMDVSGFESETYIDRTTGQKIPLTWDEIHAVQDDVNQDLSVAGYFVTWNRILTLLGEETVLPGEENGLDANLDGWLTFERYPGEKDGKLVWEVYYHPKPRKRIYGGKQDAPIRDRGW